MGTFSVLYCNVLSILVFHLFLAAASSGGGGAWYVTPDLSFEKRERAHIIPGTRDQVYNFHFPALTRRRFLNPAVFF